MNFGKPRVQAERASVSSQAIAGRRQGLNRRTLVLAGLTLLICALLIGSADVRTRADDLLLAFREQEQTTNLTLVVAAFPALPLGQGTPGLQDLSSTFHLELSGGHTVATADDAQALVTFGVGRLWHFPRPSDVTVYQDVTAHLTPDPAAMRSLIAAAGGGNAPLPPGLTQTAVQGQVREAVRQRWDTLGIALTYWQLRPPHLQTASGPSIEQLRTQLLQAYMLIQPQTAQRLLAVQDWDHTVVIPVPPGAQQRTVKVGSEPATLIESSRAGTPDSYLVWQHRGVLSYLHGPVSGAQLLAYTQPGGG